VRELARRQCIYESFCISNRAELNGSNDAARKHTQQAEKLSCEIAAGAEMHSRVARSSSVEKWRMLNFKRADVLGANANALSR
jgi:hypothetical protein